MPIPGPTPYQYKPNDDPVTLAEQNGITPAQLLQANPGGYPFSTGQNIFLPYVPQDMQNDLNQRGRGHNSSYTSPAPTLLQQRMDIGYGYDTSQRGRGANANQSLYDMRGRGYGQPGAIDQINDMRGRGAGVTNNLPMNAYDYVPEGPTGDPNNGYGGFEPIRGGDNTDFANTAAARYNAANNIPFLQQSRWDPRRRRYITVGQWLRQNRRGGRGRGGNKKPVEQKQQEFTLSNSFIDFSATAG